MDGRAKGFEEQIKGAVQASVEMNINLKSCFEPWNRNRIRGCGLPMIKRVLQWPTPAPQPIL